MNQSVLSNAGSIERSSAVKIILTTLLYGSAAFAGCLLAFLFLFMFARPLMKKMTKHTVDIIMSDHYAENVWEIVSALTRTSPSIVVENSLRAEKGGVIERPFGSRRKFLNFDGLVFNPAQLAVLPGKEDADVHTAVTIGPKAKRPLKIDIPILMGAMGYGVGVNEKAKIAMAMGTAAVGTATNSGEGGFLQAERDHAKHLIIQYHSGKWTKEPEILKQADAIEIHFGQGASAAAASRIPPKYMQGKAREILGLKEGETATIHARHPGMSRGSDLNKMVRELRNLTGGVPIGMKIVPSNLLEKDIEIGLQAKVDFISIDGAQAGTKGSPPILEDDFGLPTIYALCRAVRYLEQRRKKDSVSLLIGGGFSNPGQCLKALALGADAVYMGTAAIWAMTHTQVAKTLPFEPPTHLLFYAGKSEAEFDEQEAGKYLENFFNSFIEEMRVATLCLGLTDMRKIKPTDLVALDELTSQVTGVPTAYNKQNPPVLEREQDGMKEVRLERDFFKKRKGGRNGLWH